MTDSYRFAFDPPTLRHGEGTTAALGEELATINCSRAIIVTGSTVGTVDAVIEPVTEGLGDALVTLFDGSTPAKTLGTAAAVARLVQRHNADALVAVGGGSSLDVAKVAGALLGHQESVDNAVDSILKRGTMPAPAHPEQVPALVAVPTTLPGADLSQVAGVTLTTASSAKDRSDAPGGGVSHPALYPEVVVYDPKLVATTPADVLARSAMNGFDKGIELLYSRHRTPITDGTAVRGLELLQESLPAIRSPKTDIDAYATMLQGIAAVQYGVSTPDTYRASVIHAFGHALSRQYGIQQGVAHAIAAPHVLSYLFEHVDGRRDLLADALVDGSPSDLAATVVDAVVEVRDSLELPAQLRTVDGASRDHFPALAVAVLDDSFMAGAPPALAPTQPAIERVFEAMW